MTREDTLRAWAEKQPGMLYVRTEVPTGVFYGSPRKVLLLMPTSYFVASETARADICNGAGPKGLGWAVPDTIWAVRITEAANIHDWMYAQGMPKQLCDIVFHLNMRAIIQSRGGFLELRRLKRARMYYLGVKHGGAVFYKGASK